MLKTMLPHSLQPGPAQACESSSQPDDQGGDASTTIANPLPPLACKRGCSGRKEETSHPGHHPSKNQALDHIYHSLPLPTPLFFNPYTNGDEVTTPSRPRHDTIRHDTLDRGSAVCEVYRHRAVQQSTSKSSDASEQSSLDSVVPSGQEMTIVPFENFSACSSGRSVGRKKKKKKCDIFHRPKERSDAKFRGARGEQNK